MKHIVRDLLTLLIGLFSFSSCQSPAEIGLDIDPSDAINSFLVDTTTIRTVTIREDSLIATGLVQHPLGFIRDPLIGTTESTLAMALNLPTPNLKFGKSPVLDSAVLVLNYGDEFYGSTAAPFTINVYQLTENYSSNAAYYSNKTWSFNPAVIGTRSVGTFLLKDSLKINEIVTGAKDTLKKVAPQLRIPISTSFITSNFFNADSSKFIDNTRFNNFIKGLYVSVNPSNNANGLVFFKLSTEGKNGLDVYYRNTTGTVIDTVMQHFGIGADSTAASIRHTYTSPVQNQLNNPAQQFSTVYTQPMAGLRTKLTFPFINKLRDLGKIIINKAELVIYLEGGSDAGLSAAPRLILYRSDIADQRQPLPDNNAGQGQTGTDPRFLETSSFGGFYETTNKRYKFTITAYIQDLLSGKLTQYNTYLSAVYPNTSLNNLLAPSASGATAARSVLGGGNSANYKMKLNIIYTRLK